MALSLIVQSTHVYLQESKLEWLYESDCRSECCCSKELWEGIIFFPLKDSPVFPVRKEIKKEAQKRLSSPYRAFTSSYHACHTDTSKLIYSVRNHWLNSLFDRTPSNHWLKSLFDRTPSNHWLKSLFDHTPSQPMASSLSAGSFNNLEIDFSMSR